ncbi:MAG: ATP synthase F1 subunit delta [Flavisolibacter sp.]|nr:ATP synthase F1 subunit delta [Flavisolibacter sp.]
MLNPRVATRYAKSLLDLAEEKDIVDQVYDDMLYLNKILKGHRDFVNLFRSPVVPAGKKIKVVTALTQGKTSDMTLAFLKLLITKGREASLPEIIPLFIQQYKQRNNINVVQLTTATPISDSLKTQIINQVKASGNMEKIELEEKVDPKIIGGFILQAGDKLINASISYDLKEISKQFDNNDFVYKLR